MSTLVVCVDREGTIAAAGHAPVAGREQVASLVTTVGLDDPESSRVNSLLTGLKTADDLRADGDRATVAAVSASGSPVEIDREIARQVDELLAAHDPDGAVVVVDSAADERTVHVIESRVRVDAVSRVVVRQARDIESTYYLLKQFLEDEELRTTVLVPIGLVLLAVPVLIGLTASPAVAGGTIAGIAGVALLYKGLGIDDAIDALGGDAREALYSGQVSVVTSVVAVGLALVGVVAGAISAGPLAGSASPLVVTMGFLFDSVVWLTVAALTATAGRLLDGWLRTDELHDAYLPFVVVAVGLVLRGFAGYFLERAGVVEALSVPRFAAGPVTVEGFTVAADARLAAFVLAGVLVSLVGARVAAAVRDTAPTEGIDELVE